MLKFVTKILLATSLVYAGAVEPQEERFKYPDLDDVQAPPQGIPLGGTP